MLWRFCLSHCRQWQRTGAMLFVTAVGPYAELWAVYQVLLENGSTSDHYSSEWFDACAFYLIMQVTVSFVGSAMGMSFRAYVLMMTITAPAAWLLAFPLAPSWVGGNSLRIFQLMVLAYMSSVGVFISLDQTSREFLEKERSHERCVATANTLPWRPTRTAVLHAASAGMWPRSLTTSARRSRRCRWRPIRWPASSTPRTWP